MICWPRTPGRGHAARRVQGFLKLSAGEGPAISMLKADLQEIIEAGEGAKTEFKRDGVRPEQLAREIVSFANMNGGRILLGVEDDGTVSGVQRDNLQAWLMDTVIRRYVVPPVVPGYEEVPMEGGQVAVVDVPAGAAKPYAVKRGERFDYYLRVGEYLSARVAGADGAPVRERGARLGGEDARARQRRRRAGRATAEGVLRAHSG